ncbi:MAG: hypothetical protein ACR2KP_16855, partial [Egibacteraceae bacterium]
MTTREADALARLLDGDPPPEGEIGHELRALASLAQALQSRATVRPRPAFADNLRAELVAQAAGPFRLPWYRRARDAWGDQLARLRMSGRTAMAAGMAALALVSGGVATAAIVAAPGDFFYGLKLAVDDFRLARSDQGLSRAELLLEVSGHRVRDAERAVDRDRDAAAGTALRSADQHARDGAGVFIAEYLVTGDQATLRPLEEFTTGMRSRLTALRPRAGGSAVAALDDFMVVLDRIDERRQAVAGDRCVQAGAVEPGTVPVDLTVIPPAGEPFAACPSVAAPIEQPVITGPTPTPTPSGVDPVTPGQVPAFPAPGAGAAPVPEPGAGGGAQPPGGGPNEPAPDPGEVIPGPGGGAPDPGDPLPDPGEILPTDPGEILPTDPGEILPTDPGEILPTDPG